jgi:hypothetical protein
LGNEGRRLDKAEGHIRHGLVCVERGYKRGRVCTTRNEVLYEKDEQVLSDHLTHFARSIERESQALKETPFPPFPLHRLPAYLPTYLPASLPTPPLTGQQPPPAPRTRPGSQSRHRGIGRPLMETQRRRPNRKGNKSHPETSRPAPRLPCGAQLVIGPSGLSLLLSYRMQRGWNLPG